MCKLETPNNLLKILPNFKNDLESGKLNTLDNYHVGYSFIPTEPTTNLGKKIIDRFCKRAATDLERQRGREFGFSVEEKRVTDLTQVATDVLEKLPVHNLDCEHDLAIMDKIASRAAAFPNRKFKTKGMKDDMTLYQAKIKRIDQETNKFFFSNMLDISSRNYENKDCYKT